MNEIKAGNTVELKSGGPTMTVNFVEDDHGVLVAGCAWFTKSGKKEGGRFPVTSLKLIG
jgi:uncharacterized protein YodC (DUF2158 family)